MIHFQLCLQPFFYDKGLQFLSGKTIRILELVEKDFQAAAPLIKEVVTVFFSSLLLAFTKISIKPNSVSKEKIATIDDVEINKKQILIFRKQIELERVD
jgi:hypothetical protein